MNRRDFLLVARSLRSSRPDVEDAVAHQQWCWTVDRATEDLGEECAHFDAERFRKEAGR